MRVINRVQRSIELLKAAGTVFAGVAYPVAYRLASYRPDGTSRRCVPGVQLSVELLDAAGAVFAGVAYRLASYRRDGTSRRGVPGLQLVVGLHGARAPRIYLDRALYHVLGGLSAPASVDLRLVVLEGARALRSWLVRAFSHVLGGPSTPAGVDLRLVVFEGARVLRSWLVRAFSHVLGGPSTPAGVDLRLVVFEGARVLRTWLAPPPPVTPVTPLLPRPRPSPPWCLPAGVDLRLVVLEGARALGTWLAPSPPLPLLSPLSPVPRRPPRPPPPRPWCVLASVDLDLVVHGAAVLLGGILDVCSSVLGDVSMRLGHRMLHLHMCDGQGRVAGVFGQCSHSTTRVRGGACLELEDEVIECARRNRGSRGRVGGGRGRRRLARSSSSSLLVAVLLVTVLAVLVTALGANLELEVVVQGALAAGATNASAADASTTDLLRFFAFAHTLALEAFSPFEALQLTAADRTRPDVGCDAGGEGGQNDNRGKLHLELSK
ncbi:hypothetical protein CALVIDRAFT_349896 [Calocera viscosa TUFC12733]|uniref:Uncharacterized protein n=1 Tax=Calocera viscosa (strain TUFC12733) TaxID=1330018 RepID=A0A167QAC1_CALVF|nr:hypothetical protein CALVIDRAFT_349896 [Calocera viscosa TUFC12733]